MEALIRRLSKHHQITRAEAADHVDGLVQDVLRRLRRGQDVRLPGLGQLGPGLPVPFRPEDSHAKRRKR